MFQATALADFPKHTGYVNDFSKLLSESARAGLEQVLRAIETETKAEIVVATVPSLDGMSVEEYANRLFKEWGIGKDAVDNGVLVLVAPNEREMRIEVGYGLEGVLPDGLAGEIIRTTFLPRFREDDYRLPLREARDRVGRKDAERVWEHILEKRMGDGSRLRQFELRFGLELVRAIPAAASGAGRRAAAAPAGAGRARRHPNNS